MLTSHDINRVHPVHPVHPTKLVLIAEDLRSLRCSSGSFFYFYFLRRPGSHLRDGLYIVARPLKLTLDKNITGTSSPSQLSMSGILEFSAVSISIGDFWD